MSQSAIQASGELAQNIAVSNDLAPSAAVHSLTMWDLFWQAEPIVKLVMFGLIVASFWSWTIIFQKTVKLMGLNRSANRFEDAFWSGGSLDELYDRIHKKSNDPMALMFCAAIREWRVFIKKKNFSTEKLAIETRINRVMETTMNREVERVESHLSFLASLGTNGVIVGLFGTVVGIMGSFENIAAQQNTSLAIVAPGIAEALFATAIGLLAAIPASVAYNKFSNDINRYVNRLENFSNEFSSLISRQLDEAA